MTQNPPPKGNLVGDLDYYTRLDTCPQCKAERGHRCTGEDGKDLPHPHFVRLDLSDVRASKYADILQVVCPKCNAAPGIACRSMPYQTRLARPHAPRRRAAKEAEEMARFEEMLNQSSLSSAEVEAALAEAPALMKKLTQPDEDR